MKSTFVEIHWTNSPYSSISFRNGIRTGALQNDHRVCLVANSARKKAFENTQMISRKYIDSISGLPADKKAHIGKMNFFFKKGQPRPLFCLFSVFSNKHYRFLQQIYVKKCPSRKQFRDPNPRLSEPESPPITTRPGLAGSKNVCTGVQIVSLSIGCGPDISIKMGSWIKQLWSLLCVPKCNKTYGR